MHILLQFGGGLLGVVRKADSVINTHVALWRHDPGQCSFIGNYPGIGNSDYLRNKCINQYTASIEIANDCGTLRLPLSQEEAQNMTLTQYYRQNCLIDHYKRMLGNTVVQNWLPEKCTLMAEKLIILSHSFREMRELIDTTEIPDHRYESISEDDASLIALCESQLETPQIYRFLRGESTPAEEAYYIEIQKKKKIILPE
jgi:hypothetical protein